MQARRAGRIINIAFIGGKVSVPHLLPYSCAKFAATAFSEGLRTEMRREGITETTIIPGLMRTGSYTQAFFKGRQKSEFNWFSLSDNTPGLSISAERAAREIVRAMRRGESERVLSLPAQIAVKAQGLTPGLVSKALANYALPQPESSDLKQGKDIENAHPSFLRNLALGLGTSAQSRLNQLSLSRCIIRGRFAC